MLHSTLHPPTCFTVVYLRVFFKWIFFYLSDYILKGNLTAPLEMENKHHRRQIEGIRANRMKTNHVTKSQEAQDLLKSQILVWWL